MRVRRELLVLLLLVPLVAAQNHSVEKNVSIVCGVEQCVAFVDARMVFFSPVNSSVNVSVPFFFEFEPNVTVVQNITVVQNVTNMTVVTQNVTVQNCSVVPVVDAQAISGAMVGPLQSAVRDAIAPAQEERDRCADDVAAAKAAESECRVLLVTATANLEAFQNISKERYEALNTTLTVQVAEAERSITPWMITAVAAILIVATMIGIVLFKYYYVPTHQGPSAAEPLRREVGP